MKKPLIALLACFASLTLCAESGQYWANVCSNAADSALASATASAASASDAATYASNSRTSWQQVQSGVRTIDRLLDVALGIDTNIETVVQAAEDAIYQITNRIDLAWWLAQCSNVWDSAKTEASNAHTYADSAAAARDSASSYADSARNSATYSADKANAAGAFRDEAANYYNLIQQFAGQTITNVVETYNTTTNINVYLPDIDGSYVYTNRQSGTAYPRILIHPNSPDGYLHFSKSSADLSVRYRVIPHRGNRTWGGEGNSWSCEIAYADSDARGLRVHLLPTTTAAIEHVDYPGSAIVPEYIYWQDGYMYAKMNVWSNGTVVAWAEGSQLAKYSNSKPEFPDALNYGSTSAATIGCKFHWSGATLSGYNYFNHGESGSALFAALYQTSKKDSVLSAVYVPREPPPSMAPVIDWMRNGPQ